MPNHSIAVRLLTAVALCASASACALSTAISPSEQPNDSQIPVPLVTELSSTSIPATHPMRDTARVVGVTGSVAVAGLLNETAPCYTLASAASRSGTRIVLRVIATQLPGTCATLIAGAFDYDVGVKGMPAGTYDVDVLHRIVFNDGQTFEAKVGGKRVEVK